MKNQKKSPLENDYPQIAVDAEHPYGSIRELYLYEEPRLLDAIRRNDRTTATYVINLILVHIYSLQSPSSDLLKSLLLEFVVMMSRAAVEAGVPQEEILGLRFQHITALASLQDDEEIAAWLRECFTRIFEAVGHHIRRTIPTAVQRALGLIRDEATSNLTRDDLARRVGVSPAHLADLLREHTGRSFTELAREARIEAACRLLRSTDMPVVAIAAECGFCDQSYFTHVFQSSKKMTPLAFRKMQ